MSRAGISCDDDRMSLVRRGGGGMTELEAFREHLRVCDDCWGGWLAWRCLEAEGAVQPGDEQIIAHSADRALGALRRNQPRARRTTAAAAAAVLLTAVAASASVVAYQRRAERRLEIPTGARATAESRTAGQGRGPGAVADVGAPPTPASDVVARSFVPRLSGPTKRAAAVATPTPSVPATLAAIEPERWAPAVRPSAAALFAEATEARRAGRTEAAIAAFRRLQSDLSETPEATVSLVSLAEMLAQGGTPAAALPLFDAYLASAPAGPLYPEALVGKARALEGLGRTAEARAVRLEIGRRVSGSLYAPTIDREAR